MTRVTIPRGQPLIAPVGRRMTSAMERPWTYFLLLVVAWLAALWGLWQIGDAWVTWPTIDSATARDVARGKLWLAGGLILSGVTLGGLATLIRLVQDGFVQLQLAARSVAPPIPRLEAKPPAKSPAKPVPQPEIKTEVGPEPKREAKVDAKPEPRGDAVPAEPALSAKREPRLEPVVRLSGDAGTAPREPRFDRARPNEDGSARREPKLLRDS